MIIPRNMVEFAIFGTGIALFLLCLVYIAKKLRRAIDNGGDNTKTNWLLWLQACILPALLLAYFVKDKVNGLIIILHLTVICILFDLLFYIAGKVAPSFRKGRLHAILPFVVCFFYLAFGWYQCQHVYETHYDIATEKKTGAGFRIVQIADTHMGTTFGGEIFAARLTEIKKTNPDVVVITGDFVDDDTQKADMIAACAALGKWKTPYGIYFVFGNHDKGYYTYRDFKTADLVKELQKNNVTVLEDRGVFLTDNIYLVGRQDKTERRRVPAQQLTAKVPKDKYIIMLDHQPNDYQNEAASGADLVLSGHTHGGQMIPMGKIFLMLKLNDSIYGLQRRGQTDFIITSGMSDWAIQFKTGTKSEYNVIDIKGK